MMKSPKTEWPFTEIGWRSDFGFYQRVDGGPYEPAGGIYEPLQNVIERDEYKDDLIGGFVEKKIK